MSHADVQQAAAGFINELERAIVGKRSVLELVVVAMLADGHVLLEDVPGVAKTAIARAVAEAGGLQFARVQFTPDLIPADITGATILAGANAEPEFKPGPIFANLVLGDEINRAPPKTQSALLEAMEERQVTADAVTRPLPQPFLVIGTQNPIEQEGTYPLPEAQLDRFLIRTGIGYPGRDFEVELIMRRAERRADRVVLNAVLGPNDLLHLQQRVEEVYISHPVAQYVVDLVEATRNSPRTEAGASPRGSLALLKASRARAAMAGRSHVLPDDVKAVAVPCLAHRLILQPDQWVRGVRTDQVVNEIVSQVAAPQSIDQSDQAHMDHVGNRVQPTNHDPLLSQQPHGGLSNSEVGQPISQGQHFSSATQAANPQASPLAPRQPVMPTANTFVPGSPGQYAGQQSGPQQQEKHDQELLHQEAPSAPILSPSGQTAELERPSWPHQQRPPDGSGETPPPPQPR